MDSSVGGLGVTAYTAGSKAAVSTGATNASMASGDPVNAVWPSGSSAARPSTVVALAWDTTPSLGNHGPPAVGEYRLRTNRRLPTDMRFA